MIGQINTFIPKQTTCWCESNLSGCTKTNAFTVIKELKPDSSQQGQAQEFEL